MNATTAIASKNIPIISIADIEPVLPCSNICAIALGSSATIPENIIKETPLPIPLDVICSPSHKRNITDPTNVTTVVTLKKTPGSITIEPTELEVPSKATAKPYA